MLRDMEVSMKSLRMGYHELCCVSTCPNALNKPICPLCISWKTGRLFSRNLTREAHNEFVDDIRSFAKIDEAKIPNYCSDFK